MMGNDFLNLEDPPENNGGSGDEEKLILGKYKTVDDLAKAYGEEQVKLTQQAQELADTKRRLEEAQRAIPVQQPSVDEEDPNQLFFEAPAQATKKVVTEAMQPFYNFMYDQQKEKFRSDPLFVKYEAEIDQLANMQPQVKVQPGAVAQMFMMVKGLHFADLEGDLRERIKAEELNKVNGGLEGSTPPNTLSNAGKLPQLSDDEKRVAIRFNHGVTKEEAYKKYAEKKLKCGGIE